MTFILFAVIILFPALASIDLRLRHLYLSTYQLSEQSHAPPRCLVNIFLLVCCCWMPKKYSRQMHQSQSSSSQTTVPTASHNIQSSCNYYCLNGASQYADNIATATLTDHHYHPTIKTQVTKPSPFEYDLDTSICKCGTKLSIESLQTEERFNLMRKCSKCGGDIRPQCEGQDEDTYVEQEGEEKNIIKHIKSYQEKTFSINYFVQSCYVPLLQRKLVKGLVLVSFLALLVISILGCIRVNDGLELTDIVPRDTSEHKFLNFQRQYFSFFYMYAVTKNNFDYPNNQKLLYEYHQSFTRVGAIIKNDDGGLPPFWLPMFRDWLLSLQEAFDRDWANGCITKEGWFKNASDDGIHAYKLLVQTGRVDSPIDKELVS